jgi:copper chaperone NosL
MRKVSWIVFGFALIGGMASIAFAQKAQDIQSHSTCPYCGMDREQFAHSRFLIEYDDGSSMGTCSIHCAAIELANKIDKTIKSMQVGDYVTKKLINAETATWVLGGNKPGVMTKRAKWAFENKEDAENYIKENGGEICNFDRAMQATYEDMYADTKMIRDKRKMKRMGTQPQQEHQHHGEPKSGGKP